MKCPNCGTEWTNTSTAWEVFWMVFLSIVFFPYGLFSLFLLCNKKYCRVCKLNMKYYYERFFLTNQTIETHIKINDAIKDNDKKIKKSKKQKDKGDK